jgi:hypothetical protein
MRTSAILFAAFRLEGVRDPLFWLCLVLALGGAAMLFVTYRGIFEPSGRRLAWWLLGLRGTGVLLLVLMLARPTWTRQTEQVEPGRVAVVVDNSRSMSLPDSSGRSRYARAKEAAQKLRCQLEKRSGGPSLVVDYFDIDGTPIRDLPMEPTADFTNLTRALQTATKRRSSGPLAGVVLLSDGVDTTRSSFLDWEGTSFPVHTVGFPRAVELDLAVGQPPDAGRGLVHTETAFQVPVSK